MTSSAPQGIDPAAKSKKINYFGSTNRDNAIILHLKRKIIGATIIKAR